MAYTEIHKITATLNAALDYISGDKVEEITKEKTERIPIRKSPETRVRTRTETLIRTEIPTAADRPRAQTRSPE